MKPLLSVKNLVLHFDTYYGTVKALEGVSFDVQKRKFLDL